MSARALNAVWQRSKAKGSDRLLLVALADRSDDDGLSWPNQEWMVIKTLLSVRAVRDIIGRLVASGELVVEPNDDGVVPPRASKAPRFFYRIVCVGAQPADSAGSECADQPADSVRRTGKSRTRNRQNPLNTLCTGSVKDPISETGAAEPFDLRAPEPEQNGLTTRDALKAFYQQWADRYEVVPSRRAGDPGKMKRVCDERGVDVVLAAITAYFASHDPYIVNAGHPLGLFVSGIDRLIAASQGRIGAPRVGSPEQYALGAEERLRLQHEREARHEQLRVDAVEAINAMSADAQAALRAVAEAFRREVRREYDMPPLAPDDESRAVANVMVGQLIERGRGRSMAETAQDFEPRADAKGVA